jgi:5-methylcytosine-specific restriction enzyme subunit McrC
MIHLFEHFEYGESKGILENLSTETLSLVEEGTEYCKTVKRKNENALCFHIHTEEEKLCCKTSYFIGVDWVIENRLPVYVQPKQNNETTEIDYLKMLFEALEEPENFEHLDDLCEIYFDKPAILIEQNQDLLSPFLIVQFLQILKKIVQKGLKKSYYSITNNLDSKVKGKILINQTIKDNVLKNKLTKTVCRYNDFGFNCDENKILKKAYQFSRYIMQSSKIIDTNVLQPIVNYIQPAFENVSDNIQTDKIKIFKPNPLYKEYDQALKLALLILKRFSYNISNTALSKVHTPPFWIDMSKLFELYVFKKLREIFGNHKEVQYHLKANRQELDFLIKSKDDEYMMVVDAKYKPRYNEHKINLDDVRQVCGYARLEKVYKGLNLSGEDCNKNIDCLIIYAHQQCVSSLEKGALKLNKEKEYVNFYKIGIQLPEK